MSTPIKWGTEFLVNTTTASWQRFPTVTALANGRFLVTWSDYSQTGGDVSDYAVRAQFFSADGSAVGAEFLVNAGVTTGYQAEQTATALPDGRVVLAWRDYSGFGSDTNGSGITGKIVNPDGSTAVTEFLVNTQTPGDQYETALSTLAGGGFVVAWTGLDGNGLGICAQVYDASGAKIGGEIAVNVPAEYHQMQPAVATLANGRFVIVWNDANATDVRAQLFDADGTKHGGEFLINADEGWMGGYEVDPAVTALSGGGFVVAYQDSASLYGFESEIRAQVFDAGGQRVGAEFLVNTTTQSEQTYPCIATLADGRFVVAWTDLSQSGGDTSSYAIRAQVFAADGTRSGDEFLVNTTTANMQIEPSVTALVDGRFVVAWSDASNTGGDTSEWAIRAQVFDPRLAAVSLAGTALGDDYVGTGWNDTLQGAGGNDTLDGGAGRDNLIGGAGDDTYVTDSSADVVTEAPGAGTDTVRSSATSTIALNVENLTLTGTAAIDGTGNALNNLLTGNAAANVLAGGLGNDTLNGGPGLDTASYATATAAVTVNLALATAQATGGAGIDTVLGIENLTGSRFNDKLTGNALANVLEGGLGNDTLSGGLGLDTASYAGAAKGVVVNLGLTAAQPTVGAGSDKLSLIENLTGSNVADKLTGNAAANVLIGLGGNDTLTGNAGNDKLVGGLGNDALNGGLGKDVFRFDTAANTLTNKDTITGFAVIDDTIQLENAVFTKVGLPGVLAEAAFWKSATAIAAHDATDRVICNTTTGALYYDPDGTGPLAKVQFATLANSPDAVTKADFQVT